MRENAPSFQKKKKKKKKKKKIKCRYCCTYYEDSAVDPYSFTKRKNLKVKVGDYSENKLKRIN